MRLALLMSIKAFLQSSLNHELDLARLGWGVRCWLHDLMRVEWNVSTALIKEGSSFMVDGKEDCSRSLTNATDHASNFLSSGRKVGNLIGSMSVPRVRFHVTGRWSDPWWRSSLTPQFETSGMASTEVHVRSSTEAYSLLKKVISPGMFIKTNLFACIQFRRREDFELIVENSLSFFSSASAEDHVGWCMLKSPVIIMGILSGKSIW